MGCIYRIDFPSGKAYIGMTRRTSSQRLASHWSSVARGSKNAVHCAMRKYGKSACVVAVLVIADDLKALQTMERSAIAVYGTKVPHGYNLCDGGEGVFGYVYSEEQRARISDRARGRRPSPETLAKLSAIRTGKSYGPVPEERRKKISDAHKGKKRGPPSPETRQKMSATQKGRTFSEERRKNMAAGQLRRWAAARERVKV